MKTDDINRARWVLFDWLPPTRSLALFPNEDLGWLWRPRGGHAKMSCTHHPLASLPRETGQPRTIHRNSPGKVGNHPSGDTYPYDVGDTVKILC